MQVQPPRARKYLFVCENKRQDGTCCMPEGERIRERLKESIKAKGLPVRVSRSGCLDLCAEGPNVLLMPDNKWFNRVSVDDLDGIVREAAKGF